MHNRAFRACGLDAIYVPFPVFAADFETAVRGLCAAGVRGFNLTVPHKTAILPLLAESSEEARAIGAVNTVRVEGEGETLRLVGTNTDGAGFLRSLEEAWGKDFRAEQVLLLGAGGAAQALAYALLQRGCAQLWIANRTLSRAEALAQHCRARFPAATMHALRLSALPQTRFPALDLVVNGSSIGTQAEVLPLDLSGLALRQGVAEIVYSPLRTPLLAQAEHYGLPSVNGLGMLLHQGVEAFRFWTGLEPPRELMRTALESCTAS